MRRGRAPEGHVLDYLTTIIVLVSSLTMIQAAQGELWFDEVFSIYVAESTPVFSAKHDNNHLLNTLYQTWAANFGYPLISRLLSITCGIGSLLMLWCLSSRWGKLPAAMTLIMAGSSYPLILYFSEARGYAPAIFFTLVTFSFQLRLHQQVRTHLLLGFWLSVCLGMLAHLTFSMMIFSSFVFSFYLVLKREITIKRFILVQWVSVVASIATYVLWIRNMTIAGGPVLDYLTVIRNAVLMLTGTPNNPVILTVLAGSIIVSIVVIGVNRLRADSDHVWVLFAMILLGSPVLVLLFYRPQFLYFRYFILVFPFFYLLAGVTLSRIYRQVEWPTRIALMVMLSLFVTGQTIRVKSLLKHGRGDYKDAMAYIVQETEGDEITISSDHDLRNKLMLLYAMRFMPQTIQLNYLDQADQESLQPQWYMVHSFDSNPQPERVLTLPGLGDYNLAAAFPCYAASGWTWILYRRAKDRGTP